MPPELVPVFLFLAEVVTVVFLCLTVPLPPVLGAMALLGDRPTDPTEVALGAAGFFPDEGEHVLVFPSSTSNFLVSKIMQINHAHHCATILVLIIQENAEGFVQEPYSKYTRYSNGVCVLEIFRKIRIVTSRDA